MELTASRVRYFVLLALSKSSGLTLSDEYEGFTEPYIFPYFSIVINAKAWYSIPVKKATFEWDEEKDKENQAKHGISFLIAQRAFLDPDRVIAEDVTHSPEEDRYYCLGRVGEGILTVRFTYRGNVIRIYGAGYWRKGRKIYEDQNKIH